MLFVQVGNHEFVGTKLTRYLDSTWEGLGGKRGGTPPPEEDSSGPHPQGKPWAPLPMDGSSAVEEEWGGDEGLQTMSSATTALGAFLATGNHHGPALTASVPSRSSRHFSVDFGQVHLVALSLNGYNGVDTCIDECNAEQISWLEKDLAQVDRAKTPWVIAMSHFPMYVTQVPNDMAQPAQQQAWFAEEE